MANKNLTMHMIAGLDIGNGYVKGSTSVNGSEKTTIDFMSGVAVQTSKQKRKMRRVLSKTSLTKWNVLLIHL